MKKQIILRSILGAGMGIALSYAITILISICIGDGEYYSCVPSLIEQFGTEINAVIVQLLLSAVLGAVFAGISVIWEIETWSIVKQSLIYFLIASVTMLPVAYLAHWMEHSIKGFLQYFGIYFCIFVVTWLVQYAIWRINVNKMNRKLNSN
ncbi:MAG: DUF3021 domain-containing protein [Lachnospiraceae bacterium]|nr:DUF3021 domain-containing protein [Lachnospiraceae bacterium]